MNYSSYVMKRMISYFVVAIILKISAFGQVARQDTNFIVRENGLYYHAIFIDTNKDSRFYTYLEKNTKSPLDSAFYFEGINRLKQNKVTITAHKITGIEKTWHPLYLYKGKYYVYSPSDGMYGDWVQINDSIFLSYAGGEMISKAIDHISKTGSNQVRLRVTGDDGKPEKIKIYTIDAGKGIALFEYPKKETAYRYELRVALSKIRRFPIIVNYCETNKQDEFEFKKPDYGRLLKKALNVKM